MAEKIVVLMGGTSLEREVSLKSGERVVQALTERGYVAVALDLVPALVDSLRAERPSAVFIALHGKLGEDGVVQELLDLLGISYTGPDVLASMLAWDKDLAKRLFVQEGIPTPAWVTLSASAFKHMGAAKAVDLIAAKVGGVPVAVKPAEQGSSLGLTRVEDEEGLAEAILNALAYDTRVIIERWVKGTEVAVTVMDEGTDVRVLPPVEIVPKSGTYDYEAMYTPGSTDYFVPARLSDELLDKAQECARRVYRALGCRDLARIDMVVTEAGVPEVLECSTLPGLTETSVLVLASTATGMPFEDVVERLVKAALERR